MASSASPLMQSTLFDAWPLWWDGKNTALITFSLMVATIFSLYNTRRESRNLPPGPRGLPLLGYLPFLRPDLHRCFSDLADAYGPIISLHLGAKLCVVITSPAAAREILKDHDSTFANRDPPAAALALVYGGQDILWAPNGARWRALRKVCVRELLSPRSIDATYPLRRREVRRTAAELHRGGGAAVEVGEVVFVTALNIMTGMLWGATAAEDRERIGVEFREVVDGAVELLGMMNVSDLFPGIRWMDLQGVERRMRGFAVRLDGILSRIIDGRLRIDKTGGGGGGGGGEPSKDFLEAMLELLEREEGEDGLTTEEIKAVLADMVLGGTDTTSTTAEWAVAELLCKPEIMRKVVEELDAVAGDEAVIEESHLPELQYLDAVVRETLRLHPTIPLLVPHCPSTTCTVVGGYTIPKGTRVFINAWAIHRDPNFWHDPLEFRPERFLTDVGNRDYNGGNGFSFLPFGSGRRTCVGIYLAERMLKYVLATMLHSFEWRSLEGGGIELSEKFGIVLKKAKPLVAIPTPRFSNLKLYE